MRRRPVCILCMLLVVFLCVTDWLGFSLIRGNPLPQSVQTWIRKHPESTICGEVVRCRENEDFQSVYLRNTYLIYNSEKVSIDNIKVYLKQKKNHSGNSDVDKLLAGSLVLVSGKLEEVQSPTNPGEFDSKAYYGCQRIYYVMKKGKIKKQSQSHSVYGQFLIDMQQKFAGILEKTCDAEKLRNGECRANLQTLDGKLQIPVATKGSRALRKQHGERIARFLLGFLNRR